MAELSPAEILRELRDIHLPVLPETEHAYDMSVHPFLILAIAVAVVTVLRLHRRNLWRRTARRELWRIGRIRSPAAQSAALLDLLARSSPHLRRRRTDDGATAVTALFLPPERVSADDCDRFRTWLRRVLQR